MHKMSKKKFRSLFNVNSYLSEW